MLKSGIRQLIDFLETVRLKHSPILYTVYSDYEKAFGKVPFEVLLSKLRFFGLDEIFLHLFISPLKQTANCDSAKPDVSLTSSTEQRASGLSLEPFGVSHICK